MFFLANHNEVTPESEGVSLQKLQEDLNKIVLQRQDHELVMERRMVHLEMDMRREKEKNGDLLRQYNRLELAYQTTQDRFKKLQLHIDQLGRVGDRVLILESQLMNLQQRLKQQLSKQELGGSFAALEKEISAIHRILGGLHLSSAPLDDEDLTKTYPTMDLKFTDISPTADLNLDKVSDAFLPTAPPPLPPTKSPLGDPMQSKVENVFFTQSSSLKPNCDYEPLDTIWGQTKPSEPLKKAVSAEKPKASTKKTVEESNSKIAVSENLPPDLSAQLDAWLKNRRSWSHHDWLALLKNLSEMGFENYTRPDNQGFIGRYLETHRPT